MASYSSTEVFQSKELDGVSFTIRHLTEGRRIQLSMGIAEHVEAVEKLRIAGAEVAARLRPFLEELKGKTDEEVTKAFRASTDVAESARINRQIESVESNQIIPTFVRALLVSVDGLEIDGQPATPETMIESGPPKLYAEIARHVKREMGMEEPELGNSASPSTSNARADGETSSTSAKDANSGATGGIAVVPNTQSTHAA